MFYKDKIKYINKDLFEKIEPLGLAIWYMDDGSKMDSGYKLCTNSFTENDLSIIQDVLLFKFNINTSKHSDGTIYVLTESKLAFKKLIEPYIVDSMKYKL